MTISIGIAMGHRLARKMEMMFQRADDALYRAKAGGRNRVEVADDPKTTHSMMPSTPTTQMLAAF
jgi:predicted signal transduction protein with EAL and GGDEF domain